VKGASLARLAVRMLRYRVALMLVMFLLLGAAAHDGIRTLNLRFLWAGLSLAAAYVAATTVNDVADRDIDIVNHPADPGRPLVTGEATERELLHLHALACILCIAFAAPLGWAGVAVMALSLAIAELYSAPPIRLSYRTYAAPLVLTVAYVSVPFLLGLVVQRQAVRGEDALLCSALMALFVSRISLKDFRDREGDARFGKPTLLLRFGKTATSGISLAGLLVGDALLVLALRPPAAVILIVQGFVIAVALMLRRLVRSTEGHSEQVAIGIGARMGNGLLLTVLGWVLLVGANAPSQDRVVLTLVIATVFSLQLFVLSSRPNEVLIGYKG
jgi:4-hydroxybenzoate polyprenyltransferase